MKEVIKFLIGKFDYIKTEVLIGVLSAALIGIISRGVNCIRNVWKQNKKIKISQVFSAYAEVEQLPIVTEVKEKNNVGDVSDNIYYKKSFLKAIIENTSTRDVPIKKTWIVFDEAKKSEVRELAVNIAVPIYETDGGFYHKLREWLDRNDIVEYKYNDKPILQREIEYRW